MGAPGPEAPAPRSGSDLTVRFAAGIAMIAVAVLVTILGGWPFRAFVLLAAALMLVEWADMHKVPRLWAWAGAALAAAVLLGAAEYFYPSGYDPDTVRRRRRDDLAQPCTPRSAARCCSASPAAGS